MTSPAGAARDRAATKFKIVLRPHKTLIFIKLLQNINQRNKPRAKKNAIPSAEFIVNASGI